MVELDSFVGCILLIVWAELW